jgi:hypothetical protein
LGTRRVVLRTEIFISQPIRDECSEIAESISSENQRQNISSPTLPDIATTAQSSATSQESRPGPQDVTLANAKKRKSSNYGQYEEALSRGDTETIVLPSARKDTTDAEEGNLMGPFTPHAGNMPPSPILSAVTANHVPEVTSAKAAHRQPISRHETVENGVGDSDDDAAPEEIPLSTAQTQSHVQRAQAAGAALAQSLAQKRRRRRKDAMLKAQAASSSRKQKLSSTSDEDKGGVVTSPENAAPDEAPEAQDQISLDNLPAILPDSILLAADEAASARGAAADTPHTRSSRLNARRRAAIKDAAHLQIRVPTSKPLKDVRRSPVSVRVLETQSNFLPPKAVSAARSIRETWLKGRKSMVKAQAQAKKGRPRDNRGVDKMERRAFGVKGRPRRFT